MWDPIEEKWICVLSWEKHKHEAMRKFEEYVQSPGIDRDNATEISRPLKNWIH